MFKMPYEARDRVQSENDLPSLAVQSCKDECDINQILKKYMKTRLMTHVNQNQGNYGDFTSVQDYRSSLDQVMAAQEMFDSLPSNVRKRFENDPAEFLTFVGDPSNLQEAKDLGLIPVDDGPVVPPPIDPELVDPPQL